MNFSQNGDLCNSFCEQDPDDINSCCALRNGFCYGYDGNKTYNGDGSEFASNCTTTEDTAGTFERINSTLKNFTTLDAYIPYITISGVNDIAGTTATLTGTHYSYDYNSTVPFFRLDGVDLFPKYERIHNYSVPHTETYDLENLTTNTTYNYTFCVGYGLGWASIVCDATKNFTTGFIPTVTFGTPDNINKNNVTLHWTIDWNGATNVTYKFITNPTWLPSYDGVAKTWFWSSLATETEYDYFLQIQYETLGNTYQFNTTNQTVTTYYENAFDDIWDTLLQGSSFAKILLGFVVLFGTIFLGVGAFGKYNIQISMIAVLIFTIIGTVLASLMKLFPLYILLLIIIGSVLLMIAKQTLFGNDGGGR